MVAHDYTTIDYVIDGVHLFLMASLLFGGLVYLINDFQTFDKNGSI